MIQLTRPALSDVATVNLNNYQKAVNEQPDFATQVAFAKEDFPKKNKAGNATFDDVKEKLKLMCSGAERCHYCEDSKADEVEHLYPKDVYPELCYDWNNYFYSCGPCNTKKSNRCALVDANEQLLNTTPPKQKRNSPPIIPIAPTSGMYAFVNPETENPLNFFLLDLQAGSFEFSELPEDTTVEFKRAKHTLDVLQLNKKEFLRKARKYAYGDYKARLTEFIHCSKSGAPAAQLDKMVEEIKTHAHPTVWKEMIRQKDFISELKDLFDQAPQALLW